MKRQLGITVLFTMIFSLFLMEANAQTYSTSAQTNIIVGATYNYKVDNNGGALNYTWSVTRNTGTGTMPAVATPSANQTAITWNSAGTYTIELITEMQTGNCTVTKTFDVTVVDNNSVLAFREDNLSDCASGASGTTTLDLGLTATGGSQPWTIKYKINGGAEITSTTNDGAELKIEQAITNSAGDAPTVVPIEILSISDKYGVVVKKYSDDTPVTFPITKNLVLNQLPNTSEIQHD